MIIISVSAGCISFTISVNCKKGTVAMQVPSVLATIEKITPSTAKVALPYVIVISHSVERAYALLPGTPPLTSFSVCSNSFVFTLSVTIDLTAGVLNMVNLLCHPNLNSQPHQLKRIYRIAR